jgi:uncharacterized protein YjbI with pentapeptide repeats
MHENFKGQDLRGRSFRGQDLSYADFSDARLGSNDFTGATLTGAKFCRARFGLSRKAWVGGIVLQMMGGSVAGVLTGVAVSLFFVLTHAIFKGFRITNMAAESGTMIGLILLIEIIAWSAIQHNRFDYLLWLLMVIIAGAGAGIGAGVGAGVGTIAIGVAGALAVGIAVAGAVAGAMAGAVPVAVALVFALPLALSMVGADVEAASLSVSVSNVLFLAYSFYLSHRATRREEPQLSLLRRARLATGSVGASRFTGTLTNVDFTDADVKHANFSAAQLIACTWHGTKNLHLAQTKNTLLAPRKVRELLSSGRSADHDFSNLNLTGASFAGMDLRGFDFAHANLSHADFSGCDLSQANLCAVTAVAAKFNRAPLTDACIQNWNIDARTELADIICTRVFLGPNQTDQNPPEGGFLPGEFSKLYQQVADTVDFILHSPAELAAFIKAVDHLKSHGGEDIYVQNIERKEESIVVKLKAPEGFDRDQIFKEARQEFALQLAKAETTVTLLSNHNDLLNSLLNAMVSRPINLIQQMENHMTDKSITTGDISNRDGVVNLGNHNKISNKITLAPPEQAQLKALLDQLDQILKSSAMPTGDRDYALKQVDGMREVAAQDEPVEPGKIQRALNVVQGIVGNLDGLTQTASQIGEVAGKIGGVLGF